jgi:diguanylate cyclase (GGDEF)-like protein
MHAWWGRLALRVKTLLVVGIPVGVLVLAVPLLYITQRESVRVGEAVERTYRVREDLSAVLQHLVDAETGIRGYLLTRDKEFLTPFRGGLFDLPVSLRTLGEDLSKSDASQQRFSQLEALVQQRIDILQRTLAFAERSPAGTIPSKLLLAGKKVMDPIRLTLDQLEVDERRLLATRQEALAESKQLTFIVSVVVVPIGLLGTIAAMVFFTTGLVRSVRRIEENAKRLERGEPLLDPPRGSDELASLGHALARAAARLAEQDAQLRDLALVDPLTGLRNRRGFLEIAEHELLVAKRRASVVALLFIDVDGLKVVNDHFGHAEGDRMLCETAEVLSEQLRSSDLLARIGGDEFCVLLSRDTAMDGQVALDRIDQAIAERNRLPDRRYDLGISVGASIFDPAHPVAIDELIETADGEMYQQKRAKRLVAQDRGALSPFPPTA